MVLDLILRQRGTLGRGCKCGAQLGFHRGRIEIAADAENNIVGIHVGFVPIDQVLPRYCSNGGILGDASVGIIGAVCKSSGFALRDLADLVVSAGNGVEGPLLGDVEFVVAKLRIA